MFHTMGDRRVSILWPRQVQSVGLMREHGAIVAAFCPVCKMQFRVDLDAIIQLRGRSYSLIDQRGPCRKYDCTGKAFFMFSPGSGVPFRPLATDAGQLARMFGTSSSDSPDEPPDNNPPAGPRPPRTPLGIDPAAWTVADDQERKRLLRNARG